MMMSPHVLLIGGLVQEPIAGIFRDFEVLRELGVSCSMILSELTSQSAKQQGQSFAVPIKYFQAALDIESQRIKNSETGNNPGIVKIGLLSNLEQIDALSQWLASHRPPVIFDSIQASSKGLVFQTETSRLALIEKILPYVTILTPNTIEMNWLAGPGVTPHDFFASSNLQRLIVTGGHDTSSNDFASDLIIGPENTYVLRSPRQPGELRGSGCLFATTLAGIMAKQSKPTLPVSDEGLDECIVQAKCFSASVWRTKRLSFSEVIPEDFPECWSEEMEDA